MWERIRTYVKFFLKFINQCFSCFFSAKLLPGVHEDGLMALILVALLLGFVNAVVRPILLVLTLPINVITLGIFTFVINALMILLVDSLLGSFTVDNFWWALIFSFVLAIISSVLHAILPSNKAELTGQA
ncbi:MAG: phage holin family protein [Candidatus Caenarcaniphilales bacterium]|nr:phage holin family protein [Candidatus Caenarcaniphilales bacterium]